MATPSPKQRRIPVGQRARSVPHKRPLVTAIAMSVAFYISLAALLSTVFVFFTREDLFSAILMIGSGAFSMILWILSFLKRRDARCPLCKGTPLLDSAARCHVNARRVFPLNYGTTAVLSSIFRQKYTCQYCGTPFDLLKVPGRKASPRR